ncbi:MAG: hypothetical protein V1664_03160 [Candidatus Uhrbacteria bacterium]
MFYKKIPVLTAVTAILIVGWGCVQNNRIPTLTNRNESVIDTTKNISPEISKEETSANNLSVYQNKNLGLTFSYPADWGPIITNFEMGHQAGDDFTSTPTCEVQGTLELAGITSGLFFSAHNAVGCDPDGRGGWFGDQAKAFTDWDKITEWCEGTGDDCEIFTNSNGLKVAHAYTKETEIWGDVFQDVDLYALYNPGGDLPGIIISNERLISSGLGRSEKELRALIDSIKFE